MDTPLQADSIQPIIHVFNLHGSDTINIDFGIGHKFYKIRMFNDFA